MKNIRLLPFLIIFLLFLSCKKNNETKGIKGEISRPVEIHSAVDKASAVAGDVITLTVATDWDSTLNLVLPEFDSAVSDFEIVDKDKENLQEIDGRNIQKNRYELKMSQAGSFTIPSITIKYKLPGEDEESTVGSSQIYLQVKSSLEGLGDVKDLPNEIRSLEEILITYKRELLVGAALLTLLVIYFIYRYFKNKNKGVLAPPPLLAHEVALKELEKLKRKKVENLEAIKGLYFALSGVFRRYLQDRFRFPAIDWTTEEIHLYIQKSHDIETSMKEACYSFFSETDQVKFAKYSPGSSEIQKEFQTAELFINHTKETIEDDK